MAKAKVDPAALVSWPRCQEIAPEVSYEKFLSFRRDRNRAAIERGALPLYPKNGLPTPDAPPSRPKRTVEDFERNLATAIKDAARALPKVRIEPLPRGAAEASTDEDCLVLSDIHIGEEVSRTTTGGLGEYNFAVFQERAARLTEEVVAIGRASVYAGVRRLNVFAIGDFIDGYDIYRGQGQHQDLQVIEQVVAGSRQIAAMLLQWATVYPEVVVTDVVGNHGRMGRKGETPLLQSFDYLFMLLVEQQCAANPRIRFHHAKTWFQVVQRGVTKFVLIHGDDIKGWNSIPYYGMERAVQGYTRMLGIVFEYLVVGHHHVAMKSDTIIANASWVGPTEFAKVLQRGALPSQKMWGVNMETGITWLRDLRLCSWEQLRHIEIIAD